MADQQIMAATLRRFARTLVGDYDVDDVLNELCTGAADALGVTGAGVTLADVTGRLRFVVSTDDHIRQIETIQLATGQGPCQVAFEQGQPVVVEDLETTQDQRWTAFARGAVAEGIRAVAGFPMLVGEGPIGVLDVYHGEPGTFSDDDLGAAGLLADMATSLVMGLRRQQEAMETSEQLEHALTYRIAVEQAKGMLAERHAVTLEQARERIRSHARSTNRTVEAVAEEVVAGELDV